MKKHIAAALLTASVAGAGFAGFSITSALAEDDADQATNVQVQADEDGARDGPRPHHRGMDRGQALADAIGIPVEDLRAALMDGRTPAEVAEENGVSRDELVSAIVEGKQARLDQAVEDGRLTQEEADEKAADLEEHANAIADGERPERPEGPRGPGGPQGDGQDGEQDAGQEGANA